MNELNWITKSRGKNVTEDISVTVIKNGKNKRQTSIWFRNLSYLKFTKTGFVTCAVADNRIYFKEGCPKEGFKLTSKTGSENCGFKIKQQLFDFVGDYDLLFDKASGLCYIDATKKKH